MGKIYQNDTGVKFEVDIGQDASTAQVTQLYVERPDGTEVVWNATVSVTDNHIIFYTTAQATELSEVGRYYLQSYATWAGGEVHRGETAEFIVHKKYE